MYVEPPPPPDEAIVRVSVLALVVSVIPEPAANVIEPDGESARMSLCPETEAVANAFVEEPPPPPVEEIVIVFPSLDKVTLEPASSEPDILLNSCCGLYLNVTIFPPVLLRRKYRWKDQRLPQSHPQTKICYNLVL